MPELGPGHHPSYDRACTMRLAPDAPTGSWAVELLVDGAPASFLRFSVSEGAGLRQT